MSDGNKTEKPTHKKLEDAKKEGNHRFSDAVVTFATTFFGICVCYSILSDIPQRFDRSLQAAIVLSNQPDFNAQAVNFFIVAAKEILPPTFAIFGTIVLSAIIANIMQVGFVFQGAKIKKGITFEQGLNPVSNVKNVVSKHSLVKFFTSFIKVLVITYVCYHWIESDSGLADRLVSTNHELGGLLMAASIAGKIALIALILTLPVVVMDWGFIAAFYIKDNMMGKDEVQREHKEAEGDPGVKSQRKALAREIVEGSPHDRIPSASAVVRNPTHIAVALRFEPASSPMPYIIAMGEGEQATSIIKRAKEAGVPSYENVPFARAMFAQAKENEHVPLALSEEAVNFVYWLQNNYPERVFYEAEFTDMMTRIGDVKR